MWCSTLESSLVSKTKYCFWPEIALWEVVPKAIEVEEVLQLNIRFVLHWQKPLLQWAVRGSLHKGSEQSAELYTRKIIEHMMAIFAMMPTIPERINIIIQDWWICLTNTSFLDIHWYNSSLCIFLIVSRNSNTVYFIINSMKQSRNVMHRHTQLNMPPPRNNLASLKAIMSMTSSMQIKVEFHWGSISIKDLTNIHLFRCIKCPTLSIYLLTKQNES